MAFVSTLILRSMRMIGEKTRGGSLDANEQVETLDEFNTFLETIGIEKLMCYSVTQDTYLLISKSRFMVSPDGERWAQLHDLKTIKELYGFNSKGHLMVGFGITKEDGAQVTLDVAAGAK